MGCCFSSPYAKRIYRDPGDFDEIVVPLRYFGTNRPGSNLVPDDVAGLPSCHMNEYIAADTSVILYEAEVDAGYAFRCLRCMYLMLLTPCGWTYIASQGLSKICLHCSCDESCCHVRKEYDTRRFFRVYANRIEINRPVVRWPFGYFGCGSWNADNIQVNPFDRGAFGFQSVNCGRVDQLCCIWPVYGGVVVRQRCQCNGPIWNRMHTDCGGCWCDEWLCAAFFCTYAYDGLADSEETAFACSIALQCYFEGRNVTKEDMDKCLEFYRQQIAESTDPIGRKRKVCCEPYYVPWPTCLACYKCTHPRRKNPYGEEETTERVKEAYRNYAETRQRQVERYKNYIGPVHTSTACRALGCRRCFGRKGVIFCTEGCCTDCDRKAGDPAPPFEENDFDDDWDASTVLFTVLGPPPPNVVIRRYRWDPEKGENVLWVYPEGADDDKETKLHDK